MHKMRKHLPTILVCFIIIVGLAMLFYPDVASWRNAQIQSGLLDVYVQDVAALQAEEIENHLRRASEINAELAQLSADTPILIGTSAQLPQDYFNVLSIGNTMGRIEIPVIHVDLPIRHSTSSNVLQNSVGHLEGTSFPVGGINTHAALTAHTALPTARLFSDMEGNVNIGDYFFITVLDQRMAYKVFEINVIYPYQTEYMRIRPGKDVVTLITCTPYGINTQRLLVHGERVEYVPRMAESIEVAITTQNRVDFRLYIFVAFFVLFILVFGIYQLLTNVRDNRDAYAVPARPPLSVSAMMPTPVQMHLPANTSNTSNALPPMIAQPKSGSLLEAYIAKTMGTNAASGFADPGEGRPK